MLDEMTFTAHLARVKKQVDADLARRLDARAREAERDGDGAVLTTVLAATRALATRGGKRFRAALLAAAYEACGGEGGGAAVVAAGSSLELLQTYLLIHDDWMDDDDVRRGGPSVHAALRVAFGERGLGDASAILAGDYAAALSVEAMVDLELPPARVVRAVRELARIQEHVVFGQLLDVHGATRRATSIERVHDLKTGSYTVRGPLAIGAALAGASPAQEDALLRFGRPLGIAFQLRDDLLGTFGEPAATGKPAGNDLRQGKRTALVAEMGEDAEVARVLGDRQASDAQLDAVRRRMVESGARRRVEARLSALAVEAKQALVGAPLAERGSTLLAGAVDALAERER